jgi:hypothetical protein
MLESKFKLNQRQDFEKRGWKFITLDPGAGVPTGFPDTLVLSPNGYACYTEWKTTTKPKPLQKYWHQQLIKMGHDAFFVSPKTINEWRDEVLRKGE